MRSLLCLPSFPHMASQGFRLRLAHCLGTNQWFDHRERSANPLSAPLPAASTSVGRGACTNAQSSDSATGRKSDAANRRSLANSTAHVSRTRCDRARCDVSCVFSIDDPVIPKFVFWVFATSHVQTCASGKVSAKSAKRASVPRTSTVYVLSSRPTSALRNGGGVTE